MQNYGKSIRNKRAKIRDEVIEGDVKRAIITILATNKELDFYGTRMQESSLLNYERQAKEGVTFLDSHNFMNTGYGRTIDARRDGDNLYMDVAVLYGEKWQNMTYGSGEDLIFAMRHRDFDASIGFANERVICSVSGELLWTEDSPYYLGEEVEVDGKKRKVEGLIEDAELLEVSAVYDGATPGAGTMEISDEFREKVVSKTVSLIRAGKASRQQLVDMCQRLRIPEIKVDTVEPPPKPIKRSKKMAKSVEALETQVEDLTEENDELTEEITQLRESRKTDRAQIKQLKADNKALKEVETLIDEIETEVRSLCLTEKTELMKKAGEDVTDADLKSYRSKIADMRYKALREELEDLGSQRDIIIAIEKKEEDETIEPGDPIPDADGSVKVQQPFIRQRRVFGI